MQVGKINLNSQWYADDTTLVANLIQAVRKNIRLTKERVKRFGLEINEDNSKIVISKGQTDFTDIEGIEVVELSGDHDAR